MAYRFRLGDTLLPVAPESIEINIKNQNSTINLIDNTEFNFIKPAGLTEISFTALIPAFNYPFAVYESGFKNQKYFLDYFNKLKTDGKSFKFIISRETASGRGLYDTEMDVTLEDYTINEDAENGYDVEVEFNLKQYIEHKTSVMSVSEDGTVLTAENQREQENSPEPEQDESYTVKSGDSLWALAKHYYGDGSKYTLIAQANPDIVNPNLIYPGQTLIIPKQ